MKKKDHLEVAKAYLGFIPYAIAALLVSAMLLLLGLAILR